MVQIIAGTSGQGKTPYLIDQANSVVKTCEGTVCYIDKSKKHLHDLGIKVRLIDITEFPVNGSDGFLGFLAGLIAQDHDLEYIFCDGFLKTSQVSDDHLEALLTGIEKLGDKNNVTFILGISKAVEDLPETFKKDVISL